jgi:UDP-GlcNAc:undecaprenyl-phosphate GlcNAc-1-phosphate transferase
LLTAFLISFLVTAATTPLVIVVARRLGWVAQPRADRWHSRPTALMGGVALFAGTVAGWTITGDGVLVQRLLLPAALIFLLGVLDDRRPLRAHHKFLGQIVAAAALVMSGVLFTGASPAVALPLTFFWVLAITNAINLLDNMDGLAAGVAGIAGLTMAAYSAQSAPHLAVAALSLAGACFGFLLFNVNPARVFMGDCGSLFLGFALAALSIQGTSRSASNLFVSLLVPVAVLAIPVFDTTLVSIARILNGRSVAQGGRDHTSHRLVALGLSERMTVFVLWALAAGLGLLALAAQRLSLLAVAMLAVLTLLGLAAVGVFLGFLRVYPAEGEAPAEARVIGGRLQHTRQRLQILLDLAVVPVSLMGAHLLRFEGTLTPDIERKLWAILPLVVVLKLAALAICRAYRGVWRSAGLTDGLTAVLGSTLGSLAVLVALAVGPGFRDVSRAALIVDWLAFTVLVVVSRMGYVLLRELFSLIPVRGGPQVIILGAGAEGIVLMQRLRDPFSPRRANIAGILDDAASLHGRSINGVPVLGGMERLSELGADPEVRWLLGVSPRSDAGRRILAACAHVGITPGTDLEAPGARPEPAEAPPPAAEVSLT